MYVSLKFSIEIAQESKSKYDTITKIYEKDIGFALEENVKSVFTTVQALL